MTDYKTCGCYGCRILRSVPEPFPLPPEHGGMWNRQSPNIVSVGDTFAGPDGLWRVTSVHPTVRAVMA